MANQGTVLLYKTSTYRPGVGSPEERPACLVRSKQEGVIVNASYQGNAVLATRVSPTTGLIIKKARPYDQTPSNVNSVCFSTSALADDLIIDSNGRQKLQQIYHVYGDVIYYRPHAFL